MSEIKMDLFNIRSGNVCSLCEKQLDWTAFASEEKQPIALTTKRAICKPCFKTLKERYP